MKENWKAIEGFDGIYSISDLGRVKSMNRVVIRNNDSPLSVSERILKFGKNSGNYRYVNLCKNGTVTKHRVHKLVAEAFLGHKRGLGYKEVVDHIDHDRENNKLENLRIVTTRENTSYKRGGSEFTGVCFNKGSKKFSSYIKVNGKSKCLGYHDSERVCAQWYRDALKSLEKDPTGDSIIVYTKKFTSKYRGISFDKTNIKWRACVFVNGKTKQLGRHKTETAAYLAREKFIKENQQLFNN